MKCVLFGIYGKKILVNTMQLSHEKSVQKRYFENVKNKNS